MVVDLTQFEIHVRSDQEIVSVEALNQDTGGWHALERADGQRWTVDRADDVLDEMGAAALKVEPAPEGVYLLGAYTDASVGESLEWLRTHSLAYAEGPFDDPEIALSHRSQRVALDEQRGRADILLNGESVLAAPYDLRVRGESAPYDDGEDAFRDPWGNPIAVAVDPLGDRLQFTVTYTVEESRDTWADVEVAFRPAAGVDRVQTLTWNAMGETYTEESTPHIATEEFEQQPWLSDENYTNEAVDGEFTTLFCQTPFVMARGNGGSHLGFLDHEQSNLRFRAAEGTASVEFWAWPREQRTYEWTFEVVPGYGFYANAFLRALEPHTADFEEVIHGNCGYGSVTRRAEEAAAAGLRAVYYHGWFHRNGKYFDPDQPLDEVYENVRDDPQTYREYVEDVERAQAEGIDVCMYTQFTGVSEDVVDEFESSMVRDVDGETVVVGSDGYYNNIWANPDPDLPYGERFIEQVDDLLSAFGCAGIGMDRTDRLDGRHHEGLFDLAHFDGSATPSTHDGEHRPCSSLARQGKRFWHRLRDTLDKHDALWIANVPRSVVVFRLADAVKADIYQSPWNLFFQRAMSNGKTFFVHTRHQPERLRAAAVLGGLIQSYAVIQPRADEPIYSVDVPQEHSRLLYAVPPAAEDPTAESFPRDWIFGEGGASIAYDVSAGDAVIDQYAGSKRVDADGQVLSFPDEIEADLGGST